jgi:serine/threonine protein kinase
MEYCSGGDLSTFIKSRRTIPEKYVRRFVQQIACALKHLHMRNIAHMDLKPQNILLTSTNNPSLKLAGKLYIFEVKGKKE